MFKTPTLRYSSLLALVAGVAMVLAGFACFGSGNDDDDAALHVGATPEPIVEFTPTASATPSSTPTTIPSPTATPVPYNGGVTRMKLPRFEVDSKIEVIGLVAGQNQLDTPHDPHAVGWYELEGYGKPGFGKNALFSAHVDYFPNIIGPFNKLSKMEAGDDIVVTMEDGREYKYRVISKQRYEVDKIPMGDIIWPKNQPVDKEWVTLITCGGEFRATSASGAGEYLHRDVVIAERYQ